MSAAVRAESRSPGATWIDRVVAGFLLTLLAVGSVAMWIGVPAGSLWTAGQITSDKAQHIMLSAVAVPIAIIIWARGLFWVNRLYMRVTMPRLVKELEEMDDEEMDEPQWLRGPLESLLVGSLLVALVVMAVWFFFFAENPQLTA